MRQKSWMLGGKLLVVLETSTITLCENAIVVLLAATSKLLMEFQRTTGIVEQQARCLLYTQRVVSSLSAINSPPLLIHRCHVVLSTNLAHAVKTFQTKKRF
jgi:hypothetical protein